MDGAGFVWYMVAVVIFATILVLRRRWREFFGVSSVVEDEPPAPPREHPARLRLHRPRRYVTQQRLKHAKQLSAARAEAGSWKRKLEAAERKLAERTIIKERQDRALQQYAALPKEQNKVKIPDTLLRDLMGINDKLFYDRLRAYREAAKPLPERADYPLMFTEQGEVVERS